MSLTGMDTPRVYEIRVEGHLADHWSEWFEGLQVCNEADGEATLTGLLTDQAALFGVLARVRDLNLVLISVCRKPLLPVSEAPEGGGQPLPALSGGRAAARADGGGGGCRQPPVQPARR